PEFHEYRWNIGSLQDEKVRLAHRKTAQGHAGLELMDDGLRSEEGLDTHLAPHEVKQDVHNFRRHLRHGEASDHIRFVLGVSQNLVEHIGGILVARVDACAANFRLLKTVGVDGYE